MKSGRHEKKQFFRTGYRLCPRCGESMVQVGVHTVRNKQHIDKPLNLKYCLRCHFVLNIGEEVVSEEKT